jgi:hypothetical protein
MQASFAVHITLTVIIPSTYRKNNLQPNFIFIMVQSTYEIIKDFGVPVVTLVVGFFSGIKTTTYADRRKEFNEIVTPIYFKLKSQIDDRLHVAENFNIDVIEHHLPWYRRRGFRISAERYIKSKMGVSEYQVETSNVKVDEAAKTNMLKCANDVLHYLKPR